MLTTPGMNRREIAFVRRYYFKGDSRENVYLHMRILSIDRAPAPALGGGEES